LNSADTVEWEQWAIRSGEDSDIVTF